MRDRDSNTDITLGAGQEGGGYFILFSFSELFLFSSSPWQELASCRLFSFFSVVFDVGHFRLFFKRAGYPVCFVRGTSRIFIYFNQSEGGRELFLGILGGQIIPASAQGSLFIRKKKKKVSKCGLCSSHICRHTLKCGSCRALSPKFLQIFRAAGQRGKNSFRSIIGAVSSSAATIIPDLDPTRLGIVSSAQNQGTFQALQVLLSRLHQRNWRWRFPNGQCQWPVVGLFHESSHCHHVASPSCRSIVFSSFAAVAFALRAVIVAHS